MKAPVTLKHKRRIAIGFFAIAMLLILLSELRGYR